MTGTEMLGQQELLEPEPRRRLQVAAGHCAWWGVDPSTRGVSIAGVAVNERRWAQTQPFGTAPGPERLYRIYRATQGFVVGLIASGLTPPGVVLIEQPSGKMDNPNLSYAVGVITAAVYDGLYSALGAPVHIETCTSSWWKKRACGRGNIYKPKRKGDDYEVLTWAQRNGYTRLSWDEADAWGMAEAARREIALVPR